MQRTKIRALVANRAHAQGPLVYRDGVPGCRKGGLHRLATSDIHQLETLFDLPLTGVNAGKEGNVFLDEKLDALRARHGWEFTIGRIMFVRRLLGAPRRPT